MADGLVAWQTMLLSLFPLNSETIQGFRDPKESAHDKAAVPAGGNGPCNRGRKPPSTHKRSNSCLGFGAHDLHFPSAISLGLGSIAEVL